jgi:hypothetical protein
MSPRLTRALLILGLCVLFTTVASAASMQDGYFRYRYGRLMFKVPPGKWRKAEQPPEAFKQIMTGKKPNVILTAQIRPAMILIWIDRTFRDYSQRRITAFSELEKIIAKRKKHADAHWRYKYFAYELQDNTIKATTSLMAKGDEFKVRGHGEGMFYFRDGKSYFYYFEVLADADVFDAIRDEFVEAMQTTYIY